MLEPGPRCGYTPQQVLRNPALGVLLNAQDAWRAFEMASCPMCHDHWLVDRERAADLESGTIYCRDCMEGSVWLKGRRVPVRALEEDRRLDRGGRTR